MNTETPAVTLAESASAPAVEEQEVTLQERLNNATEEEYKIWERGGDFPPVKPKSVEPPPKTEAPAASKETSAVAAGESKPPVTTETAAAPEAAKPQKKRDIDGRVAQLLKERKEAEEKWEARFDELSRQIQKPQESGVQTASPAVAEPGKPEPIKATDPEPELGGVNPQTGKPYATVADWQKTHTAWMRANLMAEVKGELTKTEQQRTEREQERVLNEGLSAKFEPGRAKYADFDQVVGNPRLFLPRGSTADIFIRNSEHAAEVVYHLGQHPEILQSFYRDPTGKEGMTGSYENAIHPTLQAIELAKIEARLTAPAPVTPTPKPSVQVIKPLPPPPTVLSAKNSAAGDPIEEAVRNKNFADFEKAANESERRGRRAGGR